MRPADLAYLLATGRTVVAVTPSDEAYDVSPERHTYPWHVGTYTDGPLPLPERYAVPVRAPDTFTRRHNGVEWTESTFYRHVS